MNKNLLPTECCDRCGPAVISVITVTKGGSFLALCGHCYHTNHPALASQGWEALLLGNSELVSVGA